jgi:hypothetical protein
MLERQREGIATAKREAAARGVSRPLGGRLTRSSGSRRRASGPLRLPSGWELEGRAYIGCWANRTPVSAEKLPDQESAGPRVEIIALTLDQMLKEPCGVAMTFGWYG